MTSAIVTGATSFIGKNLSKELIRSGYSVWTVRRRDKYAEDKKGEGDDDIVYIDGDLMNYQDIKMLTDMSRADVIVHLAAVTPVRYSYSRAAAVEYMTQNYGMTVNVVNAANEKNIPVVYASTAEVYPYTLNKYMWTEESSWVEPPSSPYAISKYACELYVRSMAKKYVVLRPTNTFGRSRTIEEYRGYFIEKVVDAFLNKSKKLEFDGYAESSRQYLFWKDHVTAYLTILKNLDNALWKVYNVAGNESVSCGEIVKMVEEITSSYGIRNDNDSVETVWGLNPRPVDPNHIVLSNKRIKGLGWEQKYTVREGLEIMIDNWVKSIV